MSTSTLALDPNSDRFEFLKWVSARNSHIPMSELEFLLDVPANESNSENDWADDSWF